VKFSTADQLTDMLTKALGWAKSYELLARIEMVRITSPRHKDWREIDG
jgi:hypothetical protein